jgi:ribonuclease HI
MSKAIVIACDGSSHDNGKGGAIGWAWARDDGAWLSNGFYTGTNQRAELWAIWSVLTFHPNDDLIIQMDSQYALNVAQKWAAGWEKKGWIKSDKKPVMNLDLVKPILELTRNHNGSLIFQWVKGHRTDNLFPLNTEADIRAGEASQRAKVATKDLTGSLTTYLDSKGRTSMPQESKFMEQISINLNPLV